MVSIQEAISIEDVRQAQARLRGIAHRTAVISARTLDRQSGRRILLKCENLQRGGAFKFRGAYNTISQLPATLRARGVAAFSSGNHAQGVALAAHILGIPAVICMPDDAPTVKVAATRSYGAEVLFYDRQNADREAFARAVAEERGLILVPPYDDLQIMAGAGTAALELLEDVPELEALLVPIGGGGLIAGSAVAAHAINPNLRLFGVEPEGADDTRQSLRAGERRCIAPPSTIADGLRVTAPGRLTFPVIQRHVEDVLTVSDEEIRAAVRFALERLKLVIEPSGAATLAVALAGRLPPGSGPIGLLISGGNIDPALLAGLFSH